MLHVVEKFRKHTAGSPDGLLEALNASMAQALAVNAKSHSNLSALQGCIGELKVLMESLK